MESVTHKIMALIGCVMILGGCSLVGVRKVGKGADLKIIIAPRKASYRQARAALVFFTPSPPEQTLAAECTAIFQKAFLKHKVFKIIEPCSAPQKPEEHLMDLAAEKGFDILVQGRLTDYYLARGADKARAAISLKVYDLKTRVTLWFVDCAGQQAGREEEDWIFWKRASKNPPAPQDILTQMAEEVAAVMTMEK